MTFASAINLHAGPCRRTWLFLYGIGIFASIVLAVSATNWPVKLAGFGIVLGSLWFSHWQLRRQQGWLITIYASGAITARRASGPDEPAELAPGGFRSRIFVSLPLRIAGQRRRYFLISPLGNGSDDFRRLLVWLEFHREQQEIATI